MNSREQMEAYKALRSAFPDADIATRSVSHEPHNWAFNPDYYITLTTTLCSVRFSDYAEAMAYALTKGEPIKYPGF